MAMIVHAVDGVFNHACATGKTSYDSRHHDIEKRRYEVDHPQTNCTIGSLTTITSATHTTVTKAHKSTHKPTTSKARHHPTTKSDTEKPSKKVTPKVKHHPKTKTATKKTSKEKSLKSGHHGNTTETGTIKHHKGHKTHLAHKTHSAHKTSATPHRRPKPSPTKTKKKHQGNGSQTKVKHTPTTRTVEKKKGEPVSTRPPKAIATEHHTSTATQITTKAKYVAAQPTPDAQPSPVADNDPIDLEPSPTSTGSAVAAGYPTGLDSSGNANSDPNSDPNNNNSDSMPMEAVDAQHNHTTIGVSIGAAAGCIAAAGLAGMFIQRRRQTKKEEGNDDLEGQSDGEVNTRWRHQSFMNAVAGAVAQLPKRSNSNASQNNGSGGLRSILGSIRRTASNASSKSRSSEQSYGIAVTTPMPAIEPIDAHHQNYKHAY
ncbi:hypothetical protein DFQ28_003176 [Apophysomyces sp. BC1034]|nr:hypothetical protein DFQ30_003908 [Apophysomyces sp. BC1015]KAG0179211.1 hypothetical protein DFQ29_002404 [Apophysomyces sp. BC1021]KAG0189605.1 hypothetical protein DFQ28_003176 [Apophysomyces sp. BC1034]